MAGAAQALPKLGRSPRLVCSHRAACCTIVAFNAACHGLIRLVVAVWLLWQEPVCISSRTPDLEQPSHTNVVNHSQKDRWNDQEALQACAQDLLASTAVAPTVHVCIDAKVCNLQLRQAVGIARSEGSRPAPVSCTEAQPVCLNHPPPTTNRLHHAITSY